MQLLMAIIIIGACIFAFGALFHTPPAAKQQSLPNAVSIAPSVVL